MPQPAPASFHERFDALLTAELGAALPGLADDARTLLQSRLRWIELPGGATLMAQGDPSDAMYLLVSGRLRISTLQEDGRRRVVREIGRGQVAGELGLFTDEPRSATIVAVRDSVLVALDRTGFQELLALSPQASLALTRQIIARLLNEGQGRLPDRPAAMGVLTISDGVDAPAFAEALAQALRRHGRTAVLDAARLDADLGEPGLARRALTDAEANRRIAIHMDALEAEHDMLLLVADPWPTPWTQRCSRHCDELLLLADADAPPVLHAVERECLMARPPRTGATEVLVLLHPADRRAPVGTRAWTGRRPLADHVHLRRGLVRDMERLARLQTRTAVGLVLAGGGARGLAHLGVARALQEQGEAVDVIGGTSIGAVMAAYLASDRPLDEVMGSARRAFGANPTGDFNWLPLLSLIKGRRLRKVVDRALAEVVGPEPDAEDLWKGWFAVATNYSRAGEEVLRSGPLRQALMASIAIPGALPPVIRGGEMLVDGGTFNNFPVDVMRMRRGVGRVIGVDLAGPPMRLLEGDELPGSWALLRDRLRPRGRRRFWLPSLAALLVNVSTLYSTSRQRQARASIQLYFNPPLPRVGMLDWKRFDEIVAQGHAHAVEVLRAAAARGADAESGR
jgi:NTE family protein